MKKAAAETGGKVTQVHRDWTTTVMFMVFAGIAGGVSYGLVLGASGLESWIYGAGAGHREELGFSVFSALKIIPMIIGPIAVIGLLISAWSWSGEADCPACGQAISGLSPMINECEVCNACKRYCGGTGGRVQAIPLDRIAESPMFGSKLPKTPKFPPHCCVCGGAPSHHETIELDETKLVAGGKFKTEKSIVETAEVPHCGVHRKGAWLQNPTAPVIKFRSYPYLREFCALNGTEPL